MEVGRDDLGVDGRDGWRPTRRDLRHEGRCRSRELSRIQTAVYFMDRREWKRLDLRRRGRSGTLQRALEVGRDELDLDERRGRGRPTWDVRDERGRRARKCPRGTNGIRIVEGREREPLALRRLWLRREYRRSPQRLLEVGRGKLDLGERIEGRESARDIRNEGDRRVRERSWRAVPTRVMDGCRRTFLAVRGRRLLGDGRRRRPQRPVEVGRSTVGLDERVERGESVRNVRGEGRRRTRERAGR